MLFTSALAVLFVELVICEIDEYEYAGGYEDSSYGYYTEEPISFHPEMFNGRVRRFGQNHIRSPSRRDMDDAEVSGAVNRLLSGRYMSTVESSPSGASQLASGLTPPYLYQFQDEPANIVPLEPDMMNQIQDDNYKLNLVYSTVPQINKFTPFAVANRSIHLAPENVKFRMPWKSTTHAPNRSTIHSPKRSMTHTLVKSASQKPTRSTVHAPIRLTDHAMSRSTTHAIVRSTTHAPERSKPHAVAKAPHHTPERPMTQVAIRWKTHALTKSKNHAAKSTASVSRKAMTYASVKSDVFAVEAQGLGNKFTSMNEDYLQNLVEDLSTDDQLVTRTPGPRRRVNDLQDAFVSTTALTDETDETETMDNHVAELYDYRERAVKTNANVRAGDDENSSSNEPSSPETNNTISSSDTNNATVSNVSNGTNIDGTYSANDTNNANDTNTAQSPNNATAESQDSKQNESSTPICITLATNATKKTTTIPPMPLYWQTYTPPTPPTTTAGPKFDIDKFLEIIANLTYDYETNLTMQVNETLKKYQVPTCGVPTTSTTTPTPEPEYIPTGLNKTIISKCFVCGLESYGIPVEAECADAFSGDFLPLTPQEPLARGKMARFRKYCRYGDVHNFVTNVSTPRTVYGRWTGGCSVRWTDVTGIYTQRTCRNRKRAITGRHYASKRMAKLEMALAHTEEGCIVSPVATLLPLSRGISLFARFHACVCIANWCNAAARLVASLLPLAAAAAAAWCAHAFSS